MMDSKYVIKALTDKEIKLLLNDRKFNFLRPVECNHCGNTTGFQQKIYSVYIEPKPIDTDESQNFLRYHMKQNHNFDSIFFKIWNNTNYIDTAFCNKCNSNLITYDIKFGDEEYEEIAKFLNIPKKKLKHDLRKMKDRLEKGK